MIAVVLHLHAVRREGIEVRDRGIEPEFRRGIRLQLQHLLDKRNVAVVDMAIGDHMHELACDKTADLRQHVLSSNVESLDLNMAQYCIIPTENGSAVDDAYLYRFEEERFLLLHADVL